MFFPLTWTVVHPIDKDSPLFGMTDADLTKCDTEFLILLNGFDETFSQTVHARHRYQPGDIVWNARFADILFTGGDGRRRIDYSRFDEVLPLRPQRGE